MNHQPRRRLLTFLLIALLLGLAGPGQGQNPADKKTGNEKINIEPLEPDLRKQIKDTDIKDLLKELKHAARLSREGQKLTRFQVLLKIEINKVEAYRDRFATPEAEKALKALAKEEVRKELKKVASMPPGPDREKAFTDFAFVNGLAKESIGQAYQLQKTTQRLEGLRTSAAYVNQELEKLDAAAASVINTPIVPGGYQGSETLESVLKSIDEMRKNSGTGTMPKPVTQDSLDFLRDFLEPKK